MEIALKRVYEEAEEADGFRVLAERLWPRGVSKERARLELWLRDASPSPELRRWYAHDGSKWEEFRARYYAELDAHPEVLDPLRELVGRGRVTLVFASREEVRNSSAALRDYLQRS